MAASAFDLTRNYVSAQPAPSRLHVVQQIRTNRQYLIQSLYTIPAAWVLSIAPHFYAASLGKFDNKSPRAYTKESHADQSIDKGNQPPSGFGARESV